MTFLKRNIYEVEKNVERILRGGASGFLTLPVYLEVQRRLKKQDYKVFRPYEDADKIILYDQKSPRVRLYRISCYEKDELKHASILGSLFGINITNEMFGDIIFYQGFYYVYLLEDICEFVVKNLTMVGRVPVTLQEVPLDFLRNYEREYEKLEVIVASLRIDAVIAKIIGCNREKVQKKIRDRFVLLNGKILDKTNCLLRDGDIFSIRGMGKYRYRSIVGETKKGNLIVMIEKYVS